MYKICVAAATRILYICQNFKTFFYGHFNMSSFCDIKNTLVGTEREGEGARENGREKQREREGE